MLVFQANSHERSQVDLAPTRVKVRGSLTRCRFPTPCGVEDGCSSTQPGVWGWCCFALSTYLGGGSKSHKGRTWDGLGYARAGAAGRKRAALLPSRVSRPVPVADRAQEKTHRAGAWWVFDLGRAPTARAVGDPQHVRGLVARAKRGPVVGTCSPRRCDGVRVVALPITAGQSASLLTGGVGVRMFAQPGLSSWFVAAHLTVRASVRAARGPSKKLSTGVPGTGAPPAA